MAKCRTLLNSNGIVYESHHSGTRDPKQRLARAGETCWRQHIERITGEAFRLKNAARREHVAEYCTDAGLDFAFVEPAIQLANFGLVAMDMDSTLLAIESIDEIADMHGMKPQVSEITQRTMRGEIIFEESLRQRTALLQGLDEDALQQVYDTQGSVESWRGKACCSR